MAGAATLGVLAAPGAALATCVAATSGTVTCSSTTTVNVVDANAVAAVSSDNEYTFSLGVPVVGTVSSGATITGVGLWFEQDSLGQTLSVVNNGSVTNGIPGNGLEGFGNGALLTYTGNGSAIAPDTSNDWSGLFLVNRNGGDIQMGSAATPVTGTFTGTAGLYAGWRAGSPDVPGNVSIYLSGGHINGLATADADFGVFADTEPGAANIFVQTTGNTTFTGTTTGFGLDGHSGSGNVTLITNGVFGSASAVLGEDIRAQSSSGSGSVSVTENGGVAWGNFYGVRASAGGNGTVGVTVGNGTQIVVTGTGPASGIRTDAFAGASMISLSGLGTSVSATNGYGLFMDSTSGALQTTIGSGVTVSGFTAGFGVTTTTGVASLDNLGTLNAGGAFIDAPVIVQTGGSSFITNHLGGLINGTINLSGSTGPNTFSNSGTWNTSWTSAFGPGADSFTNGVGGVINVSACGVTPCKFNFGGAGLDTVLNAGTFNSGLLPSDRVSFNFSSNLANSFTNSGVLNVAGSLTFNGLSSFNNAGGLLDLRQGVLGNLNTDVVTMSGGFAGGTGSRLGLNAFLGGAGSTADQLHIGGGLTGTTSIIVADTNPGLGGFTGKAGIPLITVGGSSATATLRLDDESTVIGGHYLDLGSSGVLVKGLFNYVLTDVPGGYSLISVPGQGLSEAPIAVTGAKTIWYETATDWDQRQLHLHDGSAGAWGVRADGNVGVWLDGVGSWANRTDHQTATNGAASLPVNLSYRQNVYGVLGGIDAGWSHLAGANDSLQLGVLGGYVSSGLDFSAGGGFDYSGGLAGLSATYLNGGVFFSGLGKVDVLRLSLGEQAGFAGGSAQSITWGGLGTAGYHFTFGAGFVEPLATLAGTSTSIGGIDLRGEGVGIDFYRATTFRGALGVRFGGLIEEGPGCKLTASGMARVWQPFGRDEGWATISNPGLPFDLIDRFDRTYGDVSGRLDYVAKGTGFSASAKLGVKFADRYSDLNVGADLHWRW